MKKFINLFFVAVFAVLIFGCSNPDSSTSSSIKVVLPDGNNKLSRAALPYGTEETESLGLAYMLRLTKTGEVSRPRSREKNEFKPVIIKAMGGETVVFDSLPAGKFKIDCVMATVKRDKNGKLSYENRNAFSYFADSEVEVGYGETVAAGLRLKKNYDFDFTADIPEIEINENTGGYEYRQYFSTPFGGELPENLVIDFAAYLIDKDGEKINLTEQASNSPVVIDDDSIAINLPSLESGWHYEFEFKIIDTTSSEWYMDGNVLLSRKTVVYPEGEGPVTGGDDSGNGSGQGGNSGEAGADNLPVNTTMLEMNHTFNGREGLSVFVDGETKTLNAALVKEVSPYLAADSYGPYVPVYNGEEKTVIAYAAVSCPAPEVKFTYAKTVDENGTKNNVEVVDGTEITLAQYTDKTELKVAFAESNLMYNCYQNKGQDPVPTDVIKSGNISACTWNNGSSSLGIQNNATSTFAPNTTGTYSVTGDITHKIEVNGVNFCENEGKITTPELKINVKPWSIQIKDATGAEITNGILEAGNDYTLNIVNESGSTYKNDWQLKNSVSRVTVSGQGTNGKISVSSDLAEQSADTLLATYGGYTLAEVELRFIWPLYYSGAAAGKYSINGDNIIQMGIDSRTASFSGYSFELIEDININEVAANSSIANWSETQIVSNCILGQSYLNPFSGVFDGQNNTITLNLEQTSQTQTSIGLFGNAGNISGGIAEIKNLTVNGSIIETKNQGHAGIVAMAVGNVIIDSCTNNVTVNGPTATTAKLYTGGICGVVCNRNKYEPDVTIRNCINNGKISGYGNVGGILGGLYDTTQSVSIINCANFGEIVVADTTKTYYGGAIVGGGSSSVSASSSSPLKKLENCFNANDYVFNTSSTTVCGAIVGGSLGTGYKDAINNCGYYGSSNSSIVGEDLTQDETLVNNCFDLSSMTAQRVADKLNEYITNADGLNDPSHSTYKTWKVVSGKAYPIF